LLKNFFTCLFGGQIGTGPFFNEIGGKGIALIIFALTLIAFFNCVRVIVEIKLIIVWLYLNLSSLIIFFPTEGVIDKKTQLQLSTISWLSLAIVTFLNFVFRVFAIFVLRGDINIFVNDIFEQQIPAITDEAILPVPIKPNFIVPIYTHITIIMGKKKAPKWGLLNFKLYNFN